jgi:hypothetical protein
MHNTGESISNSYQMTLTLTPIWNYQGQHVEDEIASECPMFSQAQAIINFFLFIHRQMIRLCLCMFLRPSMCA